MLISTINHVVFRRLLLTWYKSHQRCLPWRITKDPYKIWLSEIILQQTRVMQGLPYYERFVAQYPSVAALAGAKEEEILRLWQGLGYYSRARNLHQCAQTIVAQYNGDFPTSYHALLTLKGIGPYTAAAIAAFAFKEVVAAVDGNVYRVLARIFGLTYDVGTSKGRKQMHQFATLLVDHMQPDTYSQAIMDFGALQCTPVSPFCTTCVFNNYCIAYATDSQKTLPVKTNKLNKKDRYFDYFILQHKDAIYMKKRVKSDIWKGMYDFYLLENKQHLVVDQMDDPLFILARSYHLPITTFEKEERHLLTHQRLFVKFHKIDLTVAFLQEAKQLFHQFSLVPFNRREIEALPKPILIQRFLKKVDLS
ncbi:MAG: A/G-specific adenine glycosylase [Candidatus Cardinium sp.]|uniref:A/G-specific adenine glycosylase n=1 Tax=Cardinium endosymbiont of Dermatophagoides farinae TaxID=2597823 RepID=UPI001182B783|nr:A/G-specific adenine glycosylase [Cardinium endosymbiont of Dermatophagoides farinae]TSJ80918.1 A/G-specific adenine glycosylase [Cardinium endosymbiont of Dermatophagoides farinae]UWW96933.1 MAG: A/G-specific adenine glycosylase [Candidatus Cardinium sp.]